MIFKELAHAAGAGMSAFCKAGRQASRLETGAKIDVADVGIPSLGQRGSSGS